jgi:3',5'-cyclic AMP phosphodiesterase CpdA
VTPPGVAGDEPFSFIVIGDTGEGDASQHVLRDQLITAAAHQDVRFVVLSSDVVYPTGAAKDYETKFWLPFKGVSKPVYAIPGNHDWYDALEGFVAAFFEPGAARVAMKARVEADQSLSSTTDGRIESLVAQASALRSFYGVPTGYQQAPFFQVQTDRFALIAVDTGVLKSIDAAQRAWLHRALAAADGKLTMAIVGHPFYAGGVAQDAGHEAFAAIHQLLREHHVAVVMAGDTHDLEYYGEPQPGSRDGDRGAVPDVVHHFVNGGGGAYLSFGTALAWPSRPATPEWAFYPTTADVSRKIESRTPFWKRPAWWWTRWTGAWPFSPEWLSAAFDYNVAPFFQSFVEVRVEPAARLLRIRPYGVHGRLRWRDLQASPGFSSRPPSEPVEWVVAR